MLRHGYTCYEVMKDLIKVSKLPQTMISLFSSHKCTSMQNLIVDVRLSLADVQESSLIKTIKVQSEQAQVLSKVSSSTKVLMKHEESNDCYCKSLSLVFSWVDIIPESETFYFNLEEISSGSPTTHSELSLLDYKAFYVDNDHFKEKSSGSTTTHVDFSQYDSFIFDLSNDQFPPADRSDLNHEEFADELTHIMSLPNLECFKFKVDPDPRDLTSIDPEIRKNVSTTNVNVPLEDGQSSLFAYVVWIFLAFLTYLVVPPYLLSTRNEDTIFDPGISMYHSFMPDVSHRSGTFMKFNVYPNRLKGSPMMTLSSTCFPMDQ
ncbi:hypothetical protein Tco_0840916 [Tanacetum coccineum]|uniref:Uncharacterized protein n=1 Tax=Tanacetum coccineum TaxID=301880 RepID=A0ABQ5AWS4_9ASTR